MNTALESLPSGAYELHTRLATLSVPWKMPDVASRFDSPLGNVAAPVGSLSRTHSNGFQDPRWKG
ncbi:uncharacterized protein PG986_001718 [Apiospora aurea]|uniref:Uncharacterized protein n=1 Tax=Apiospora aurea TaxID=335848 RepID=A0ABR1QYM0_9PEZI